MTTETTMIKRNGAAIRNLLIAVTLVSLMYFVYMYHDIQYRLRHSELVTEKFKRDKETLSSQLSEINLEKAELRNKYFKDRQDLATQYSESERKYKMLLTQHQSLENEFSRLQEKYAKYSEDTKIKDVNRNQEYMQLKQEKDMEIVKLKDINANILREKEQLRLDSIELKKQVEQQQQDAFQAWNYASQLKKTVEHLQKNNGAAAGAGGAAVGAGGAAVGAGGAAAGAGHVDAGVGAGGVGAGVADDNNNKLNMLHKSINDRMGQANHFGLPDNAPKEPVQLQNFQIQPAHVANGDNAHDGVAGVPDKPDETNNGALQKEEILHRQNEGANDHNQVQPPLKDTLNDVNESEEDKDILNMLSNQRHKNNKMVEDFKLNNDLNEEGNQPLERINVEDNLAGREPNDHPRLKFQGHFRGDHPRIRIQDDFRGDLKNENKPEKDNAFEHEFQPDDREVQGDRWRNQ